MLYSEGVRGGRLTITRMVEVLAAGPARVGGMYPRKGALALGSDGDVVVFDPDARRTIRATEMHSACDYDPYEGWEVTGWPETVLSRGEIVFERGKLAGPPGRGKLVPRAPYPASPGHIARSGRFGSQVDKPLQRPLRLFRLARSRRSASQGFQDCLGFGRADSF